MLTTVDQYFCRDHVFEVQGMPVVVSDDLLAEALTRLPQSKRDVILLYYFQNLRDVEIGKKLKIVRSTVTRRRLATLQEMRAFLEKGGL